MEDVKKRNQKHGASKTKETSLVSTRWMKSWNKTSGKKETNTYSMHVLIWCVTVYYDSSLMLPKWFWLFLKKKSFGWTQACKDDDPTWSPLFYIYNGPSRSTLCSSSSSFVFLLIGEVGPSPKMLKSNQPSMHACGRRALMHMHAVARLDFPSCFAFASKELITYKWCRLGRPVCPIHRSNVGTKSEVRMDELVNTCLLL
jgi:hypothetical protein